MSSSGLVQVLLTHTFIHPPQQSLEHKWRSCRAKQKWAAFSTVLFYKEGFWKLETYVPSTLKMEIKCQGDTRGVNLTDLALTHS